MRLAITRKLALPALFLLFDLAVLAQGHGPGGDDPPGHEGHEGHEIEHNLVLPQVAVGPNITTTIVLHNLGGPDSLPWATAQQLQIKGTIFFFNPDGTPMIVNGPDGPASEFPFVLEQSRTLFLQFAAGGIDRGGWALIGLSDDSNGDHWGMMDGHHPEGGERLMATAFYSIFQGGGIASQVGVIPSVFESQRNLNSILAVQADDNGVETGIAVVNISGQEAKVDLTLRGTDGQVVAATTLDLPAGNQKARFLNELFGDQLPIPFLGTFEVSSTDDGVIILGLLSNDGLLTSVPTRHYGHWTEDDN